MRTIPIRRRRIRFAAMPGTKTDAGPLLLRQADGQQSLRRNRRQPLSSDASVDMPYPTAGDTDLTPAAWLARWPFARSRLSHGTDLLLSGLTGFAVLLPFLLLKAPDDVIRLMLVSAAVLLFYAGSMARLRLRRDETIRIHARFWDRLITTPPSPADPDDTGNDTRMQAARLRRALEAALKTAEIRRTHFAGMAIALTITVLVAGLPSPVALWALLLPAIPAALLTFFLERQAGRSRDHAARLEVPMERLETRIAALMPMLRQLGRDTAMLTDLDEAQRHHARIASKARLTGALAHAAPAALAVLGLTLFLALGFAPDVAGLPVLCLLVPGLHAFATLGRSAGELSCLRQHMEHAVGDLTPAPSSPPETADLKRIDTIALKGIGFRYPHARGPLFEGLSLSLKRGEVLALTGPSGSGKSTFLDILMGLKEPQTGRIAINGTDCDWSHLAPYRARIAGIFQDMLIGFATLRTAIALNAPEADEATILRAADDAGLTEAIATLPMGLETLIVEGGFPLSLIQQVMIAQAIVQNPDLLVLDETFSSLDLAIAAPIVAAVRRRGITLVFATHRGDLAALADRTFPLAPSDTKCG